MSRPKSTGLHKVCGTFRADRHGGGLRGGGRVPRAPSWLSAEAKAKWRELAPHLARMGCLTRLDTGAFAVYCTVWSAWRAAVLQLQQVGSIYRTKAGLVKRMPLVAIAGEYARQLAALGADFGLSPLARVRLRVDAPTEGTETDALTAFLGDVVATRDRG